MNEVTTINDPSVWTAADFPQARSWVRDLDDDMIAEIDAALASVKAASIPWHAITHQDFVLPTASRLLAQMANDLESGPGFAVAAGLPVDRYTRDDNRTIWCGISAHIGRIKAQTHKGDRIIDVVDLDKPYSHESRGYSSNALLPFHTDGAHTAGLLCLGEAETGGRSIIVSASAVYNVLVAEHPDALAILERGFYHHRRGEQPEGESPLSNERIPVFSFFSDLLHVMYNRNPIEWVEHEGVNLSKDEVAALDTLDAIMARPQMQLHMDMRAGDMQFINNFVIFHSRTEYQDSEHKRRHLLRIWLETPESRRTGPTLLDLYAPAEAQRRGADHFDTHREQPGT